ncbi:YqaJ-like viral recombinase family protein [Clostridium sp. ASBs410]|nr:YqaJ-like viral recombinase family protein [Clostridium sp. ASBs410]
MKKLISTKGLSHEDWLKYRKQGIGGSDAGAICGLNPYVSPMSAFYEKTSSEVEGYNNESMRQGLLKAI